MTAHSKASGHPISYVGGCWVYDDTRHSVCVDRPRPCRLCGLACVVVDLGGSRGAVEVDACIAGIVLALNEGGVATVASCCGHGRRPGSIILADGREILVLPDFETSRKLDKLWPSINEPISEEELELAQAKLAQTERKQGTQRG